MAAAFTPEQVDRAWLRAWLEGRSVSRGLPLPVCDHGAWRVESDGPAEIRRWVFDAITTDLTALAQEPLGPGHAIKATVTPDALRAGLPPCWSVGPMAHTMLGPARADDRPRNPDDFRLELRREGPAIHAFLLDPAGRLAASGHAGAGESAFVHDRIVTREGYRRRGLARQIMAALHSAKPAPDQPELLCATEAGRTLYEALGWITLGPYASASWQPN